MKKLVVLMALFMAACSADGLSDGTDVPPSGRNGGTMFPLQFPPPQGLNTTSGYNGIYYHGGPIMLGTVNMYYIWYGTWNDTTPTILTNFANSVGGSPYFNINTTYTDGNKNKISNSVVLAGSTNVGYTYGTALTDGNIISIVSDVLKSGALPTDTNGIYFVLTSADVNETSGFCTKFCGWHTSGTISGKDIKYAFIGNPSRCITSCAPQSGSSPNNNPAADGMVSIVAHELEEATTDPDLNAWYDRRGYENADKCAWTWGTTYTTSNGAKANMNLGGMDYLIQRNWVNVNGGYCALSY